MHVAAVDLGASSGRVMLVEVAPDRCVVQEVSRFANRPRVHAGHLRWDIAELYAGVLAGLRRAVELAPSLASIGIDSWAVDYGLLDADGQLLGDPIHYRDDRTDGLVEELHSIVSAEQLYAVTGLQQQPFNTAVQLLAAARDGDFGSAATLLLIPDLLTCWLTGQVGAEHTNASTTQLLDVRSGEWSAELLDRLGLPRAILPEVIEAGVVRAPLTAAAADAIGAVGRVQVVAVGSHDTASAIVAVPATTPDFAYISSGTWSLVGVELDQPVLTNEAREANFTNEVGVDGTIRFLRNVMGMWLVQQSLVTWAEAGQIHDLATLLTDAAELPPLARVIDPDDPSLLPPGDQPARIARLCESSGQTAPGSPAEVVRTILDSLALAYRRAVRRVGELSGKQIGVIHVVGGGANNELLCQLTANACGLPLIAGPVEAAAIGNALIQARTLGAIQGDLAELRGLLHRTQMVKRYEPQGDPAVWAVAEARQGAAQNFGSVSTPGSTAPKSSPAVAPPE